MADPKPDANGRVSPAYPRAVGFPKRVTAWECSDGEKCDTRDEAERHERWLSMVAWLRQEHFGVFNAMPEDMANWLRDNAATVSAMACAAAGLDAIISVPRAVLRKRVADSQKEQQS